MTHQQAMQRAERVVGEWYDFIAGVVPLKERFRLVQAIATELLAVQRLEREAIADDLVNSGWTDAYGVPIPGLPSIAQAIRGETDKQ